VSSVAEGLLEVATDAAAIAKAIEAISKLLDSLDLVTHRGVVLEIVNNTTLNLIKTFEHFDSGGWVALPKGTIPSGQTLVCGAESKYLSFVGVSGSVAYDGDGIRLVCSWSNPLANSNTCNIQLSGAEAGKYHFTSSIGNGFGHATARFELQPAPVLQFLQPSSASVVSGVLPLKVHAPGVTGVNFSFYYSPNPNDPNPTYRWWGPVRAVPAGEDETWSYSLDTRLIPDQDDGGRGLVNVMAVGVDGSGNNMSNPVYMRVGVCNHIAPQFMSPMPDSVATGSVNLRVRASGAAGVRFDAYYATDPYDISTVGWHNIGVGVHSTSNDWSLNWDTTAIPDQGNGGWGTVNIGAIPLDSLGNAIEPGAYCRLDIKNAVPDSGRNMLFDPSFEIRSTGWRPYNLADKVIMHWVSDAHSAKDGQCFVRMLTSAVGGSLAQDVGEPVNGCTYSFSIWLRAAPGSTRPVHGSVAIWALYGKTDEHAIQKFAVSEDWTKVTASLFVQQSDYHALRAEIYLDDTDTALDLDDAAIIATLGAHHILAEGRTAVA
jgi:hypothetical protein